MGAADRFGQPRRHRDARDFRRARGSHKSANARTLRRMAISQYDHRALTDQNVLGPSGRRWLGGVIGNERLVPAAITVSCLAALWLVASAVVADRLTGGRISPPAIMSVAAVTILGTSGSSWLIQPVVDRLRLRTTARGIVDLVGPGRARQRSGRLARQRPLQVHHDASADGHQSY